MVAKRLPRLPELLGRKISKTGQTRGADDDVIYQNRVNRSCPVLIPYRSWEACAKPQDGTESYEHGFIVLLSPPEYFANPKIDDELAAKGLALGMNALVFYETREQWEKNNPDALGWRVATKRTAPLGGYYAARVPANTGKDTAKAKSIIVGFHETKPKGAGIRVFEYASKDTMRQCRLQLEALFWLCGDSEKVAQANGMTAEGVADRKAAILDTCRDSALLDAGALTTKRILNSHGRTICPLCLEELSGQGFFNRMAQAEGRDVPDLTVTQLNLFHIEELRYGALNHRPYNMGWGHHHCNVVVRDIGIIKTLEWMRDTVNRNISVGYLPSEKRVN